MDVGEPFGLLREAYCQYQVRDRVAEGPMKEGVSAEMVRHEECFQALLQDFDLMVQAVGR